MMKNSGIKYKLNYTLETFLLELAGHLSLFSLLRDAEVN